MPDEDILRKFMKKKHQNFSKNITSWVGSTQSLLVHTIGFAGIFSLRLFGFSTEEILLILTTIVSLEAIYLSIFIQITINQHSDDLEEVSEDIEELQEDVEEIQKDVDEIQEDVEEISEDVDEIPEDVEEISEDVGELQEDVEEISEEDEMDQESKFEYIEHVLQSLLTEIKDLKHKSEQNHLSHPEEKNKDAVQTQTKNKKSKK